ncbi:pentatricopeptide repeat-containing protein At4g13650-like [Aristolochia californica]|uniref:pentatricopeptide repeat-containing protein At4g13650-like n=1 Tax=Aristolochia californica TaxID=171875 RepID=UPI0035DE5098
MSGQSVVEDLKKLGLISLKLAKKILRGSSFINGISKTRGCSFSLSVDSGSKSMSNQVIPSCFIMPMLRNAAASQSIRVCQMAHSIILRTDLESNLFKVNMLLHAYFVCGGISSALQVFNEMRNRDVVSWNTMISGFVRQGFFYKGFSFLRLMKRSGIFPTQSTFTTALVASKEEGSFTSCQLIHGQSLKLGLSTDCRVGNSLLTAYVGGGSTKEAVKVFGEMNNFDETSCEILSRAYLQEGASDQAFELFRNAHLLGITFSDFALSSLIKLCGNLELVDHGIQIHGYIIKAGFESGISIANALITMYARYYKLDDSEHLFECLEEKDIVTWNSMIGSYAFNSLGDCGVRYIASFLWEGLRMNTSTFSSFLSCCSSVTVIETAKMAHAMILKFLETLDQRAYNIILTMYCRCRSLSISQTVFRSTEKKDIVSYNLLLGLYRDEGFYAESVKLLRESQLEGFINVDERMFLSIISSCAKLLHLDFGVQVHGCIVKNGFERLFLLGNSLLELYSQCGEVKEMERIFREIEKPDLFSWNVMIMGYTRYGFINKAIRVWHEMKLEGIVANEYSYTVMIDLCDCVERLAIGEQIHGHIYKSGMDFDTALMNSLLSMYSNCGLMEKASLIFEDIHIVDAISWNAMVSGCVQNGFVESSLKFYLSMNSRGIKPNQMTFLSICKSCAMLADMFIGSQFHAQVIRRGFECEVPVSNSLITMYAKCGNIRGASKIFRSTMHKDMITWNSMICGYACHGFGAEALSIFAEMKFSGFKPNAVTFVGVLSACSHAGLISEALDLLSSMYRDHNIVPNEEHYTCVVDVLCRAGKLREAKDFILKMPFEPPSMIWRTVLRACRENGNLAFGEEAGERILQWNPKESAGYVLLSNIYASVGKLDYKAYTWRMMKDMGVRKETGCSWICS